MFVGSLFLPIVFGLTALVWLTTYFLLAPSARLRQLLLLGGILSVPFGLLLLSSTQLDGLMSLSLFGAEGLWLEIGGLLVMGWSLWSVLPRLPFERHVVQPIHLAWRRYLGSLAGFLLAAQLAPSLPWSPALTMAGLVGFFGLVLACWSRPKFTVAMAGMLSAGLLALFLGIVAAFWVYIPDGAMVSGVALSWSLPNLALVTAFGLTIPTATSWWLHQPLRAVAR